jgi:RND family efflux transporter MFP subunit
MNTRSSHVCLSCLVLVLIAVRADAKPPEVPVARAVVREVTDHEDFTGRTDAAARVELRARVTGYLLKTAVKEGAEVKKGDVLFEIDSRPYRAELDKVEAALKLGEARLRLAEANLKRVKALFDRKTASQEDLDRAAAERTVAEAEVRAAQANREVARLNLDFTRVVAPIDGRIGRQAVDPGNLVKADDTILATLVNRDPMHVYFDVEERSALRLLRSVREDKGKDRKIPAAIGLAEEDSFPRRGVVDLADNHVNADTGTLRMRAVLPNKDGLLMPGLFVRVRLTTGAPHKELMVPRQAVMVEERQRFVYVVNDKDAIERRDVQVGQASDGWLVATRGLKADERVVVGRLSTLRPGITVRPREEDKPAPKPKRYSESGPAPAAPSARAQGGAGIFVEAAYPGANVEVVSDAVRAPIEDQIRGVEKLRLMRSRCTNEGKYALSLSFARGADLKILQVLVQNRVNLAVPALPDMVKNTGVSIRRGTSGPLMIVHLSSPEGKYDERYLSNYANLQIKDELAHLSGVGDVTLLGSFEDVLRVWLDPDKLAARGLNAGEVMRTIEKQKEVGGVDADKLPDLIVKAGGEGRVIRLKDVGRVELGGAPPRSRASFNGKPVIALVIRPDGEAAVRKLRAALGDTLSQLRERLPKGLDLALAFDFTNDTEHLLLDVEMPAAAERVKKVLDRCGALLRQAPDVRDVLAMSENPFDLFGGGPCILVALTPADKRKAGRDEVARTLRTKLDEIKELTVRVRDLSGPDRPSRFGYPLDLAVRGPELARAREFTKELAGRLNENKKLTDVWMNPDAIPQSRRMVDIDRTAAAKLGVALDDVLTTLQVYTGSTYVNDFVRFGRTWRVQIQGESGSGDWAKEVRKLRVRGARGQMVPLGALVQVQQTEAPAALDFLDGLPMIEITANPASGVKLEEARKLCETLAEEVRKELRLPADYRLFWLP